MSSSKCMCACRIKPHIMLHQPDCSFFAAPACGADAAAATFFACLTAIFDAFFATWRF